MRTTFSDFSAKSGGIKSKWHQQFNKMDLTDEGGKNEVMTSQILKKKFIFLQIRKNSRKCKNLAWAATFVQKNFRLHVYRHYAYFISSADILSTANSYTGILSFLCYVV